MFVHLRRIYARLQCLQALCRHLCHFLAPKHSNQTRALLYDAYLVVERFNDNLILQTEALLRRLAVVVMEVRVSMSGDASPTSLFHLSHSRPNHIWAGARVLHDPNTTRPSPFATCAQRCFYERMSLLI